MRGSPTSQASATGSLPLAMPNDDSRADTWTVIADEPNQLSAEGVCRYLRGLAIPARIDAGDTMSFLGPSSSPTRVLVPADWTAEAEIALARRWDDDPLPPAAIS